MTHSHMPVENQEERDIEIVFCHRNLPQPENILSIVYVNDKG